MPSIFSLSIPQLSQWSRRQPVDHRLQNEPVDALNRMTTGIGLPRQTIDIRPVPYRSVVLTEEPDLSGRNIVPLKVRALGYADRPPIAGVYVFVGAPFLAYPALGSTLHDFVGLAWLQPEPPPPPEVPTIKQPDLSAAICEARLRNLIWHIHPPVYSERLVVCHRFAEDDADGFGRTLIAQEVATTFDEDGVWTGELTVIGDSLEMNVWPTMKANDFGPFLWEPQELNNETIILPLTFWHGTWWIKPQPKLGATLERGPLRIVDCQPPGAQA